MNNGHVEYSFFFVIFFRNSISNVYQDFCAPVPHSQFSLHCGLWLMIDGMLSWSPDEQKQVSKTSSSMLVGKGISANAMLLQYLYAFFFT